MFALQRAGVGVALLAIALLVTAVPASAHTVAGQGATDYRTTLEGITPATPGLRVTTLDDGSLIQLTWTGTYDLSVLGYDNEPYLRVGPGGVYRNRLSPSTYLNVSRVGGPIPSFADPKAAPEWVRLSGGHTAVWHDHRIHWMGGVTGPELLAAPHAVHLVDNWTIPLTGGGRRITINGRLDWVPGPSPWPWVALIVALAAVGVVAGLGRRWAGVLCGLLAVLIAVDMAHAVGVGFDQYGSVAHKLLFVIAGSYYSIVAWVVGAIAIRLLLRKNVDGLFATVFAGLVIGLFGGLVDVVALARSQVPFLGGPAADRAIIAVSCGAGAGALAGAIIAYRRNRPAPANGPPEAPLAAISGFAP